MTVLASSSTPGSSYAQAIAQLAYGLLVARLPTIGGLGAPSLGPSSATIITS
jgi:hypothetical protein